MGGGGSLLRLKVWTDNRLIARDVPSQVTVFCMVFCSFSAPYCYV